MPFQVVRPDERFRTVTTFVGLLVGVNSVVDTNGLLMGENPFAGSAHKFAIFGADAILLLVGWFPLLRWLEQRDSSGLWTSTERLQQRHRRCRRATRDRRAREGRRAEGQIGSIDGPGGTRILAVVFDVFLEVIFQKVLPHKGQTAQRTLEGGDGWWGI